MGKGRIDYPTWVTETIRFEQYLLDRARDNRLILPDSYDGLMQYMPEGRSIFPVHAIWVDERHIEAWQSGEKSFRQWKRERASGSQYRLLIHPLSFKHYRPLLNEIKGARFESYLATPTSSCRTVIAWPLNNPGAAALVKLSVATKICGVDRTIRNRRVEKCVKLTDLLDGASDLPSSFAYFGERFGISPLKISRGGMILRDNTPSPNFRNKVTVPLFSLHAEPKKNTPSILFNLILRAKTDPREYLRTHLVSVFSQQWASLAIRSGIVVEPHGQNLLMEFNLDGTPSGRFVHRDFEDVSVDIEWRRKTNLYTPKLPSRLSERFIYDTEKHVWWLRNSLSTFFFGGVLYPIERKIHYWSEAGLISNFRCESGFLRRDFMTSLAREISNIVGFRVKIGANEMTTLDRLVLKARASLEY
ncbi:IucA/IucC family protein [Cupriavidus sp. AcVe19-6a]|uniref:IucA/IucC family protein n=1 Tax=Cupriavidus sp. AcVe19-6a TaxID=2821358 RepID=UPI001AE3631D|nr:IucA/IucC family protein [Cupriavidus sp. AcVe19-6a]MBP0635909.1 hypothetical protein [Cupriavidus sp. AcVe19-6a]